MQKTKIFGLTAVLFGGFACWALAQTPQYPPLMPASPNVVHASDVVPMSFAVEQDLKPPVVPDKELNQPGNPDQQKKQPLIAPGELKDPTKPGSKLQDAINMGKAVVPGAAPYSMPTISLRGRVITKGQEAMAVLEMDGHFYVVTKGSKLVSGGNVTLVIEEVTSLEVRIELSPSKEVLILR